MTTVFEKIIAGILPAEIIFENSEILAIKDMHPIAPVHILIMPKKHFPNIQAVSKDDLWLVAEIMLVAQKIAKEYHVEDNYRLITNNGPLAGQSVFHLHFHLIAGKALGAFG